MNDTMEFQLNRDELSPHGGTITPVTLGKLPVLDTRNLPKGRRSFKLTLSPDIPPAYHTRPPPLVQPVKASHFIDQTYEKYGLIDLAHEWVALFRSITAPTMTAQDVTKSIKMYIPETVFLSPSGQPDVWYVTSTSSFVKARTITHVTPSSILEAFRSDKGHIVALGRRGFQVDFLTLTQLEDVCKDMEQVHLTGGTKSETDTTEASTIDKYFCLQKYIPRIQGKTFLLVSNRSTTASKTNPKGQQYDLFLILQKGGQVQLEHIDMDDKASMKRSLIRFGFDEEVLSPLLMRMRYLTFDMMNRVNKSAHTKQMVALACEFFVSEDNFVYFSSLVGLQWENQVPTWEKLSEVDAISRAIHEYYSSPSNHKQAKSICEQHRNLDILTLYDQLNPRFPSIQSSLIAETQWKCRSPLLAPHVSPRYFGAEMPKKYRKGLFRPLLTEEQSDAVNRLYLSPRGTGQTFGCRQIGHPLSPSRPDAKNTANIRADPQRSLKNWAHISSNS